MNGSSPEPRMGRPALETSDALLAAGVSKPVFACQWPETRALAERLWSELPRGLASRLYDEPYHGGQDAMQDVFLESWLAWRRGIVALDDQSLRYRYATAGSSEAIRECLAQLAVGRRRPSREPVLHVLNGEYEGYGAVADGYGIRIERHDRVRWRESFSSRTRRVRAGDLVMISQPSAIDGNLWPEFDAFLHHVETELPDVSVAVDLAYVGAVAREYEVAIASPVVSTVFFSLSKVFGVYYHRIGGVLSRTTMPGLIGTKWFKNTFSLELGRQLLAHFPPRELAGRHGAQQAEAIEAASEVLESRLNASDVVLLAHHPWREGLPAVVAPLRRGDVVRYCLTPSLDRLLSGPRHGQPRHA